ncbi:hypothetical protein U2F26_30920 [Micromonospora sp. 4G57]|uniref:Uncharacterized protein n=1 Tax=Micromonospora sicca TaxID=2202420 RepID=A0ABU5JK81_9ACTN|nr:MULTISPECIES: hypothetical protein [unclassified Micromonospora]MDZ5447081.1 hypothetical protein [Micromonospora sp. 4G57]MDZ5493042.1 hypothetical protein [Micromonospora sp. 4G53]
MELDASMADERSALTWLRCALADFYIHDRALLRARVSEWGLTFRLGHHLAHHADPAWDVDAEYDRQGMKGNRKVRDPDAETHMRPDLIVHQRGRSGAGNNLLFVEVKRRWRAPSGDPEDIDKVRQAVIRHKYQVAVAVGMRTAGRRFSPTWAVYVSPPLSRGTYTKVPLVPRLEPVFDEAELDDLERAARRAERMPSPRSAI